MVEVSARARWFAKGAARGSGAAGTTLFEDRSGTWARSDQWSSAFDEPDDRPYLRNGLLVVGVVAAGFLLARRSTRGGAPLSPPSDIGGTRADAPDRATPAPTPAPSPPSEPAQGPADGPGGASALRRPESQDAVEPTTPYAVEPPGPEAPTGRPAEELDRAPAEDVPPEAAGTPSVEAATAGGLPAAQEGEQPPAEEAPSTAEELPPPPQASEVQLPPPIQPSDVELSPPPSTPDVESPSPPPAEETPGILEELPPPPDVEEVELSPPPPASENVLDELPAPPVPEEQSVGDMTPASPETPVEPEAEAPRAEEPQSRRRVTATPAARRRAKELGIDLLEVEGTGKNGKITVEDVLRRGEQTQS